MDPDVLVDHKKVTALSIKKAAIASLVEQFELYESTLSQEHDCEDLIAGDDAEVAAMAKEELPQLETQLSELTEQIQKQLVTADEQSVGSIILEVRAGVGGDEATIWASDLEEMYRRFSQIRGWKIEEMDTSKTIILSIAGEGVWTNLGFESGTHQVKRVPATETQGPVPLDGGPEAIVPITGHRMEPIAKSIAGQIMNNLAMERIDQKWFGKQESAPTVIDNSSQPIITNNTIINSPEPQGPMLPGAGRDHAVSHFRHVA